MVDLLGVGVGIMVGIAVQIAATSGVVLVAGRWLATCPLAPFDSTGVATASTSPIVDGHAMDALVLPVLATQNQVGMRPDTGSDAVRDPRPAGRSERIGTNARAPTGPAAVMHA